MDAPGENKEKTINSYEQIDMIMTYIFSAAGNLQSGLYQQFAKNVSNIFSKC